MLVRVAVVIVLGLSACASTEWVHPTKSADNFAVDYNTCEQAAYQDPKNQAGTKLYIQRAIDRCIAQKGWELREKR